MLRQSQLCYAGNEIRFEDRWPSVRGTVSNLFYQRNVTKSEWQELFMLVHSIALWDEDGATKVRSNLSGEITKFIKEAQKRVMQHQEDSALLKAYITEWRQFFTQCDYLPLPFQPLETVLGKAHLSGPKKNNYNESIVRKLMLDSWNVNIFQNIKHRLQESAMKLVQYERNGDVIDSHLVIGVRESYVNLCTQQDAKLQIYQEHFERAYLDSTEAFYRTRAVQYMREHGVQNYMKYASTKLAEEQTRADRYLETRSGVESVNRLVDRCVEVLVTSFKEEILAECQPMIRSYDTEKLKLLFHLMDRVSEGVAPMLSALEDHIRQAGLENMHASKATIVTDSEKYVERLLLLFNQFTELVEKAFNNDHRFLTSRDKAYKDVVNDTSVFHLDLPANSRVGSNARGNPESKCPELLANYCDMLLRKTPLSRKFTSEEIERRLREVLLVLKYVQNKDVFIRYHKAHLTRRLILDTSADNEIEESMVEWLREVGMPADVVNKLARMFQDIKVSNDLNTEFKETIRNNNTDMADTINIKILNSGAWMRQSERIGVSLPRELEDYIPQVEEFYKKKHNGRKLQWNHLMSNGLITMDNELGRYDLEVTTFQMAVLYAWNSRRHDRISFESLRLATGLPENELRRTVWSLVQNPKLKRQLLLSNPEPKSAKDFTDNTEFRLNPEFAVIKNGRAQKRGKINLIGRLQLQTERVREEENEAILKLRVLRIQEAIVKIMKMRKRLRNAELYTELVELLKNMFVPSKKMIKEQIEWLIENKYLNRDDNDLNVFHYVA